MRKKLVGLALIFVFGVFFFKMTLPEQPQKLIDPIAKTSSVVTETPETLESEEEPYQTDGQTSTNPILSEDKTVTPVTSDLSNWKLVWEDDFNKGEIDQEVWNIVERDKNYNKELEKYKPDHVSISDGNLVLTASKSGNNYFSGLVTTDKKLLFQYGKIEIRAKFPVGKGLFPALWMLPTETASHAAPFPEIDIFEAIGSEPNITYGVFHFKDENGNHRKVFGKYYLQDLNEYHVYSIEWERSELRFYVDQKMIAKSTKYIPDEPMCLIMNLAVGGIWAGTPNSETIFPSSFQIDYVKYFQKTK